MGKERFTFSLRWKLALLFGGVFLMLHSVFSYLMFLEAKDNFADKRRHVENSHVNIAKALTEDSYAVLEQFAEVLSLTNGFSVHGENPQHQVLTTLDENWSRWQLSWDIENIALFDKQGMRVKSWGNGLIAADDSVKQVLSNESPIYRVFCSESCYQQTIIPLMKKSETTGAFSVIRSFADIIIKYKKATESDIGVLIVYEAMQAEKGAAYKLSGMTSPEKNKAIFDYLMSKQALTEFLGRGKTLELGDSVYEVVIFPVQHSVQNKGPFFLLIHDITADVGHLNDELQRVWAYGIISLSASVLLLALLLRVSLRRVERLSEALPLLSQNKYDQFRKQLAVTGSALPLGSDELDKLNQTALSLTDQLEHLEQEVRGNTFVLLEKSQDLAKERDFIRQLVDTAPIIIITQKLNGIILSVNQAGMDGLEADSHSIIGKVFDVFVPESDQEHLKKLNQLRTGDRSERFRINGFLLTRSGKQRATSWLHTLLKSNGSGDEPIILSLGVDISEQDLSEERSRQRSGYDPLTGLLNRQKFQDEFAIELASAKRYGYKVALFYLDLDRFNAITANKDNNHEAGDHLLQQVANILKDAMRSTDLMCRFGGDEFAVIMPHAELQGVQQNASKIIQMLESYGFNYAGENFRISTSIGIAVFPQHGLTVNELLANADLALNQVKASGGAGYRIFTPDRNYQTKLNKMLAWQELIENAIAKDKLVLLHQPVVHVKSNEISYFECLIRLQKDDGALILPEEFIGYAEELELIGKIDRWVLKKAVQKLIKYRREGRFCRLSVNLSAHAFKDNAIFDDLSRLINVPGVDPGAIIFDISEAAAVANFAAAETLITQLKGLGCLIALDNFGVGLSSIYYLKHFPVDYIKLDGSFIRHIDQNDDDKIFVKAITGLAHAFNKKVVAEFVENEAILAVLKDFGVDYVQGDFLGKPAIVD